MRVQWFPGSLSPPPREPGYEAIARDSCRLATSIAYKYVGSYIYNRRNSIMHVHELESARARRRGIGFRERKIVRKRGIRIYNVYSKLEI